METYTLSGTVQRFPGHQGWFYLEVGPDLEPLFRPIVRARWPALLGVDCAVGSTRWRGSMMPIKAGPLFIALPAKVRRVEALEVGAFVVLRFSLRPL